jgi:hypothetical protein
VWPNDASQQYVLLSSCGGHAGQLALRMFYVRTAGIFQTINAATATASSPE